MKTKAKNLFGILICCSILSGSMLTAQDFFGPVSNTGETNAVVIQAATINGSNLKIGDEIGIFDADLCVGAVVYTGSYPLSCTTIMQYQSPGGDVLPGARTGYQMLFKIWSKTENKAGEASPVLKQGGNFGDFLTVISSLTGSTTSVGKEDFHPSEFALQQNYPNPFNPVTNISFTLASAGKTVVNIYDVRGRNIRTLVDGILAGGNHEISWNGKNNNGITVKSGMYLLSLKSGNQRKFVKMTLVK